ncbi:unnamed protein product [Closterium sp. Yama58-4]|nr:unnamed protein product [Closterium sp. Yama58-4]
MEDQRQFVTGYLAQPYLFNSLPRTPYPETNFTSIQSLIFHQTALAATDKAATSSRTPTPGTLKYLCAVPGPLQDLIPEDVTPEKLEAARQAAPAPFIKLDHYNALMELLGGRRFEQFEVQGSGAEIKVYSRVTKAYPCIFHQSGDKLKRGVLNEIVENGTLDAIAFEGMV